MVSGNYECDTCDWMPPTKLNHATAAIKAGKLWGAGAFERAIRESKPGDVFFCSDKSWPRFDAIARQLKAEFSDKLCLYGNIVVHNLTRKEREINHGR